jgi:hypothetical protein
MNTWQPIETAPKDDLGKALIFDDGEPVVGEYLAGQSSWYDSELRWLDMATHWMPLPAAPTEE